MGDDGLDEGVASEDGKKWLEPRAENKTGLKKNSVPKTALQALPIRKSVLHARAQPIEYFIYQQEEQALIIFVMFPMTYNLILRRYTSSNFIDEGTAVQRS